MADRDPTVIKTGGSGGWAVAVIILVLVIVGGFFLLNGGFTKSGGDIDVNVKLPTAEAPAN